MVLTYLEINVGYLENVYPSMVLNSIGFSNLFVNYYGFSFVKKLYLMLIFFIKLFRS